MTGHEERPADDARAWARAREAFLDLADLPADERDAALAELEREDPGRAAWVRRLLDQDLGADAREGAPTEAGPAFGPYRAVRRIAVGGMGEVLLARRSDGEFEREVAVKHLRPGAAGEELVQRFLRERQTLAGLDHEYIARLLDGGRSASGQPYLVLEYVEGRHVDVYCREEGLGIRERVELFVRVLEAVRYAHARGVVHRDLKPSNVLVRADGTPRLLDFGIARTASSGAAAATLTGTGQRLFTPEFASPEQVRGEPVTQASDTFSLGVILYSLLAGEGPWAGSESLYELERSILERDPAPPSRALAGRARRQVAGDLDTIVLRCLEKRPERRFASVDELAEELERHLAGFPIRTRSTGIVGRLVRRGRRNPWQALAAAVLLLAAVAGGLALRAERVAETHRRDLVGTLAARVDHARNLGAQDRFEQAVDELRAILASLGEIEGEEVLRAEVLGELSGVLTRIGGAEEARELARRGLRELPAGPAGSPRVRALLLLAEANALRLSRGPAAALDPAREAHRYAHAELEPGDALRLEAAEGLAAQPGLPLAERIAVLEDAEAEARARGREHDGALSSLLTFEGFLLLELGEPERALACFDESLEIDRWNHGEGHGDVALVRDCRGTCLRALGRREEAREEFEAAHATFVSMGQEDMAAVSLRHLGEVKAELGDLAGAVEDLAASRERHAALLGSEAGLVRLHDVWIGDAQRGLGRWPDARASYERALEEPAGPAALGPEGEADARLGLARVLLELGEDAAARREVRAAVALRTEVLGPDHEATREALALLAR